MPPLPEVEKNSWAEGVQLIIGLERAYVYKILKIWFDARGPGSRGDIAWRSLTVSKKESGERRKA